MNQLSVAVHHSPEYTAAPTRRRRAQDMAAALVALRLARRARRPPHQLTRAFIPDATQLLVDAQACTGLPWYATIPCATFALRSALVPASIVARRHGRRINLAAPHLRKLQQLAAQRSKEQPDDKMGTAKLLGKHTSPTTAMPTRGVGN